MVKKIIFRRVALNPLYEKKRRLYILPQYHAGLIQPEKYKESHIFATHVHVLSTLCTLGLKILECSCTFLWALFKFPCAKNYG